MTPGTSDAVPGDGRRQGSSCVQVFYRAAPGLGLIYSSLWIILQTVSIKPDKAKQRVKQNGEDIGDHAESLCYLEGAFVVAACWVYDAVERQYYINK